MPAPHPLEFRQRAVELAPSGRQARAVIRFHKGPPIVVDDVDTPSMNARDSYGEREAPLLHGIR
jgi:hypothetical protein